MVHSTFRAVALTLGAAVLGLALVSGPAARGQTAGPNELTRLETGRVRAENAHWIENPLSARFNTSKRVVVADLQGPAEITMIHFALPQSEVGAPLQRLDRAVVLLMTWDGETTPSVAVPLVDFFCDPAGLRDEVKTELVNKRRGFNAYFPMPFRKSARVELVYDGPLAPGDALWRIMPCYSYVMYRTLEQVPASTGLFHAAWRQESLRLGERDYLALEALGRGKFVGWNATVRLPGRAGYPVDQNEKFFVDGEATASVEFQGMEDSFGFSWGFHPPKASFRSPATFRSIKVRRATVSSSATRSAFRNRSAWRSASASTKTRCSGGSSPGPALSSSFRPRSTGTRVSRMPRCRPCHPLPHGPRPRKWPSGPRPGRCRRPPPCGRETSSCTCSAAGRAARLSLQSPASRRP